MAKASAVNHLEPTNFLLQMARATTLGELKKTGYQPKSVKEELRDNLIEKLSNKKQVFEGILGFEDTVIPDMERAILSRHNIILLGLRGQAKTRLARLCLLYTSPSPRDRTRSRMPSSA